MIGFIIGIIMLGVTFALYAAFLLIFRFDWTNALLASAAIQLLGYQEPWSGALRRGIFAVTTVLFVILQHCSKVVRVLFSIFSTVAIATIGYSWIDYSSVIQQMAVTVICVVVSVLLNRFYWERKKLGIA